MKRAYYARSKAIYGTPQEDRDKAMIEKMGYTVIEINTPEVQEEANKTGMQIFKQLVGMADALFFRSHIDGMIGAGVVCEIEMAEGNGLPVVELPHLWEYRKLSIVDTRAYLSYAGQR